MRIRNLDTQKKFVYQMVFPRDANLQEAQWKVIPKRSLETVTGATQELDRHLTR